MADRNLLFGILALQMDFITRDQLVAAMNAWVLDKTKPLAALLHEQQALSAEHRQLLEAMVAAHVKQHGDDPEQSLAAVSSASSIRHALQQIADPDVQASLGHVGGGDDVPTDPDATRTYSAGMSTSTGLRFRILRPHAHGGLGEVFVAQDQELHREVALKEIQARHAENQEARTRFLLEAEITGGLEHPGIVPVYGLGQHDDGRPFYAMRFIKGDSLKDAIERFHNVDLSLRERNAPAERDALDATSSRGARGLHSLEFRKLLGRFIDVCEAIQYAHDRGVLHRDLKPGNIMLGKYGETLVVDWGLAKPGVRRQGPGVSGEPGALATGGEELPLVPASASGSAETLPGSAVGTPSFMSPEQAAGRLDQLGPASDVYSLGATLYVLLTGKPPVEGKNSADVLKRVREGDISRPREVAPEADRAVEAVCVKAMALKPADRYASPRALADDLERWLADKPVSAWPEPIVVRAKRWARQHQTLVTSSAASLFIALVALTVGLVWYQDEQNQRTTETALRQAEADRKRALAEEAIRNALDQAEKPRQELHAILAKPGGVFGLLNEPARWAAFTQTAKASLKAAQDALTSAEVGVDPTLTERATRLRELLERDDSDRLLAGKLEQIRIDGSTLVQNNVDYRGSGELYSAAFAEADVGILKDPPVAVAARLTASPIREQLLAALDYWAFAAFRLGTEGLPEQLLQIGRLAAPDPTWGDQLRRVEVWRDQPALVKLAREAPAAGLSPPLFQLIGNLMPEDNPATLAWHRHAQAQHPEDFWLNYNLAYHLYENAEYAEAAGFCRVALAVRPSSSGAWTRLGISLRALKKLPEAIAALQKAIELDPRSTFAYTGLGLALNYQKKLPDAEAACHKAIELAPKYAGAHSNLCIVLSAQNKLPEAIAACHKAIELDPKRAAGSYNNLGSAFYYQKKLPEAIAAYHKAIELDPKRAAGPYRNLGGVLLDQKKLPEAIAAFHKALELDPKSAGAYYSLGNALLAQQKLSEAIAAFHRAIGLKPDFAEAHSNLGHTLKARGEFAEALKAMQKGHELGTQMPSWRYPSSAWVKHCESLVALESRLPLVFEDSASATANELLQMASMCQQYQKRYATSVRLYRQAFEADPKLVRNFVQQHRYNAACAAALAGTGQDAKELTPKSDRPALRGQAHDWLQADLNVCAQLVKDGKAASILFVEALLAHWQADTDFIRVRDTSSLANLPEAEQAAWRKLWADVDQLQKQIRSLIITETTLKGTLTDQQLEQVHEMKLEAGKAYVIDMKSIELDSYLKLHDPAGKLVVENDDIAPGNQDSHIVFTPKEEGVYRITATSFEQRGRGAYTLTIRAIAGK
jgi:serine/threonine protein kinase/Flp pilus assembly protein TadD